MQLGIRGKLFLVSLFLILVVGGASGLYLEIELRRWLEDLVEQNMRQLAQGVRETFLAMPETSDEPSIDALADRLGAASGARVTIIEHSGHVLGDSNVGPDALSHLDNHAHRPEIEEAERTGLGMSRRRSATLDADMLYVAIPYQQTTRQGYVRIAMPLTVVDNAIHRLRLLMVVAGLVGLAIAVLMSLLASHLLSRTLRKLVVHSRALVEGAGVHLDVASSDEIGRLAGSFNKLADALQRTVQTLAQERGRFHTVLESMSEAVLAIDAARNITLVNHAAISLLRLSESPLKLPLLEVIKVPSLAELLENAASAPASLEFSLSDAPNSPRLLAHAAPLASKDGTVIVMLDVTETRRLETIRKDFVANVSHELRTPVSIIRANAETLLDGALGDPERARGFVEALHRHSERLSRIIADLLDLSRMEAGRYKLEIKAVPVLDAVTRAVQAVDSKLSGRRLSVDVDAPDELEVKADAKALEHVLFNLLDNAVKYSPDGGDLVVRARPMGNELRIEVEDHGAGISAEHRDRIFERFYRVDQGRAREAGGTGLGLAIVKHLVDSMLGKVGVDPAEPKGSVFWFTLPLVPLKPGRLPRAHTPTEVSSDLPATPPR